MFRKEPSAQIALSSREPMLLCQVSHQVLTPGGPCLLVLPPGSTKPRFRRLGKGAGVKAQSGQAAASRETSVADNRVEANWILKAMIAVASSDHQLDAREIGLIQSIYQDRTGRSLSDEEIARTALANSKGNLLTEFSEAGKFLDQGTKEEIVRSAYLVLLADNRIAGEERKKLQDISAALRIPEIHFGAILEDLAVWLAGQKS